MFSLGDAVRRQNDGPAGVAGGIHEPASAGCGDEPLRARPVADRGICSWVVDNRRTRAADRAWIDVLPGQSVLIEQEGDFQSRLHRGERFLQRYVVDFDF